MRVALPEGQSADLRERLTYGQAREVRAALVAIETDRAALVDLDLALVRAYVESWHVLGVSGDAVPLASPETAPDDVIQTVSSAALKLWNSKPDPKDTPAPSTTSPQAQP